MNKAAIKKLLASATTYPYGWIVAIPAESGTLFERLVTIHFDTRLLPSKKPPPAISAEEQKLAGLVLANLPDLLAEVTRRFNKYNKGNKHAAQLCATVHKPHIWISRDVQEDEGSNRWSFVIGFEESEDYAIDVEFEGLKCIDVAGGD